MTRESTSTTVASLFRLGGPIALGRTAIIGMGIVDLVVVGQLAGESLPQLTLAYSIVGVLTIGGIGLMLGVQVLAARAVGAGTPPLAGAIWRRGIQLAVLAGAAVIVFVVLISESFFLLVGVEAELAASGALLAQILSLSILLHLIFVASTNFLEALKRPVPGAVLMWVALLINLVLNLILVPVYGVLGSVWTTVAARLFLAVSLVVYILSAKSVRQYLGRSGETVSFMALLSVGGAATISGMVEAGAFSAMGLVAVRISPEAMAVFSIASGGLLSLVGMLSGGLGAATAVLVSRSLGEGDDAQAARTGWTALVTNLVIVGSIAFVCYLFAEVIAGLFTSNIVIASLFAAMMGLVAILFLPDLGQMVLDPALRARGDNWYPTVIRLVCFVGIAPLLAFWLVEYQGYDLSGVFVGIITASSLAFLALLVRWISLGRMREGKK